MTSWVSGLLSVNSTASMVNVDTARASRLRWTAARTASSISAALSKCGASAVSSRAVAAFFRLAVALFLRLGFPIRRNAPSAFHSRPVSGASEPRTP